MWRFVQGIPRAIRGQWRSAPQTVCREDDKDGCRGHVAGHGPHPTRGGHCVVHTAPLCTHASARHQHQHHEPPQPEPPEPDQQEDGTQYTAREDQGAGGPDRDNWFHEWLNSFRHECHTAFSPQQNCVLEAVGWGSALLLGTQFAHYQGLKRRLDEHVRCCPLQNIVHLYRYALAMPNQGGAQSAILPQTQGASQKQWPEGEEDGDIEFLHDRILLQEDTAPTASKPLDQSQNADDANAFSEAETEWNKLTKTYRNVSENALGYQYSQGGQYGKAVPFWRKASADGYAKAQFNMGLCYELGKGVHKDLARAAEFYRLAASANHAKGLYNLGVMYLQGSGGLVKDPRHALDLLESAAMQGLRRAQTELGVLYTEEEHNDMKKAASLFQMAATQQDATGQYYLGICFENGWGVERNEHKAGVLYSQASEAGHATAAYNLAVYIENGLGGLPKDTLAARDMYARSALLGNREAERDANRLEQQIEQDEVSLHLQVEPGRCTLSGDAKPGLSGSASSPSLSDYISKHLLDFSLGEFDDSQAAYGTSPKRIAKRPSVTKQRAVKKLPQIQVSDSSEVKFYIGDEDEEEEDINNKGGGIQTEAGNHGLLGGSFGDSGYSSFNGGSRSCSLNELNSQNAPDIHLVSCT